MKDENGNEERRNRQGNAVFVAKDNDEIGKMKAESRVFWCWTLPPFENSRNVEMKNGGLCQREMELKKPLFSSSL